MLLLPMQIPSTRQTWIMFRLRLRMGTVPERTAWQHLRAQTWLTLLLRINTPMVTPTSMPQATERTI